MRTYLSYTYLILTSALMLTLSACGTSSKGQISETQSALAPNNTATAPAAAPQNQISIIQVRASQEEANAQTAIVHPMSAPREIYANNGTDLGFQIDDCRNALTKEAGGPVNPVAKHKGYTLGPAGITSITYTLTATQIYTGITATKIITFTFSPTHQISGVTCR